MRKSESPIPSWEEVAQQEELDSQSDEGKKKKTGKSRDTRTFSPGDPRGYCNTEGCTKWFNTTGHRTRHIRTCHTKEKPFSCPYAESHGCTATFSRADNMRQHAKTHEKGGDKKTRLLRKPPASARRSRNESAAATLMSLNAQSDNHAANALKKLSESPEQRQTTMEYPSLERPMEQMAQFNQEHFLHQEQMMRFPGQMFMDGMGPMPQHNMGPPSMPLVNNMGLGPMMPLMSSMMSFPVMNPMTGQMTSQLPVSNPMPNPMSNQMPNPMMNRPPPTHSDSFRELNAMIGNPIPPPTLVQSPLKGEEKRDSVDLNSPNLPFMPTFVPATPGQFFSESKKDAEAEKEPKDYFAIEKKTVQPTRKPTRDSTGYFEMGNQFYSGYVGTPGFPGYSVSTPGAFLGGVTTPGGYVGSPGPMMPHMQMHMMPMQLPQPIPPSSLPTSMPPPTSIYSVPH